MEYKVMKIENFKLTNKLRGFYEGSDAVYYCLISKDLHCLTPLSTCRAWIIDTTQAFRLGHKKFKEIGYDRNSGDVDLENLRIGVTFSDKEILERAIDFINKFEKILKFKKTKVYKDTKHDGFYMLVGDRKWLLAPALISLYTLFLRNLNDHKMNNTVEDTLSKHDYFQYELKGSIEFINKMLQYGIEPFFYPTMKENWSDLVVYDGTHGYGIYSFSSVDNYEVMECECYYNEKCTCSASENNEIVERLVEYGHRFDSDSVNTKERKFDIHESDNEIKQWIKQNLKKWKSKYNRVNTKQSKAVSICKTKKAKVKAVNGTF